MHAQIRSITNNERQRTSLGTEKEHFVNIELKLIDSYNLKLEKFRSRLDLVLVTKSLKCKRSGIHDVLTQLKGSEFMT